MDPGARPIFVKVLRDTGPAGWTLLSQILPRMEVRDDAELALVEDLLRAMPDRADPVLGEAVAKFLAHPLLRPTALAAIPRPRCAPGPCPTFPGTYSLLP